MFDYSWLHWLTFISAALLLNLSPGPDIAFILGQTARNGRRGGFAAIFGVWSGTFLHVLMAALGLSAILMASSLAFSLLKWLGAAYLVYLGIQALRSGAVNFKADTALARQSVRRIYWQGTMVSALNPKVAVFFLAFLPQFVVPDAGPVWAQLMLHGVGIILVAALIEPPLVLLGDKLLARLQQHPRIAGWFDKTLGGLLITFGVRLAFTEIK